MEKEESNTYISLLFTKLSNGTKRLLLSLWVLLSSVLGTSFYLMTDSRENPGILIVSLAVTFLALLLIILLVLWIIDGYKNYTAEGAKSSKNLRRWE
jgi:hypothetical protein